MMVLPPYTRDDDLINATLKDGQARFRLERFPGVAAVLGRGSDYDVELKREAVRKDGIPVFRRPGGGCAVLLDPGNLIVSVTLPLPGLADINRSFNAISDWMIEGLAGAGVPGVGREGVSDLVLAGNKIGGSCIYRAKGLLYYSTTLLVDPDMALVDRYISYPPREPDYRSGRSHRQFMGSLARSTGVVNVDRHAGRLASSLPEGIGIGRGVSYRLVRVRGRVPLLPGEKLAS